MPTCTNKGCGKTFDEAANYDTSCEHHPGAPVFHEGLKSWSCCTKKVTDFDDFLKIPGCAVGKHSTAQHAAPASSTPASAAGPVTVGANGVETYGTPTAATPAAPEAVAAPSKADAAPVVKEEDLNDAPDAQIPAGATCQRNACGKKFDGEATRTEECVFHPGQAVFHEGSKGWSCCSRKVLEFDEFLKIKGCTTRKHRFTDVKTGQENTTVQCRHDWYQTQSTVTISIFAKKVDKAATSVVFTPDSLKIDVKFLDGKTFPFHTQLAQPIDPAASKFEILSTKIELVLKKANGISWASIEPNDEITSWTTFGTVGGVGTVGGKTPLVAGDVDVLKLRK
ncbi:HSP20-like chaperone [Powellomyces hirtus]|nr:HSP20-like chaperone [Powellomyces hirtus]